MYQTQMSSQAVEKRVAGQISPPGLSLQTSLLKQQLLLIIIMIYGFGSWPTSASWFSLSFFMWLQSDVARFGLFLKTSLLHVVEVTHVRSTGWCWL